MELKIQRTKDVKLPNRGTSKSAGVDFYVPKEFGCFVTGNDFIVVNESRILLSPGGDIKIASGIKIRLPDGWAMKFDNKSGVSAKRQLIRGACLVDEDYQGELFFHLINVSNKSRVIRSGQKIIQGRLIRTNLFDIVEVGKKEDLYFNHDSERGEGGFGSTDE